MSTYTVRDLTSKSEMDDLVELLFRALGQPYIPANQILFPCFGYSAEDRAQGLAAAKDRLWLEHCRQKASSGWIYVVDDATKELVAASQWKDLQGSPFPDGVPKIDLYWWPSGEAKEFCENQFQQVFLPRSLWMQRPHGGVERMIVHPDYRSRGIGSLMMELIVQRLDDMSLEGFVEASELGRPLYEKWGFQTVMKVDFYHPLKRSATYNRIAHDLSLPSWYAMWRPIRGVVEDGKRRKPWQNE